MLIWNPAHANHNELNEDNVKAKLHESYTEWLY